MQRTAIITGALKGLGLETARELLQKKYQVVLTGRDRAKGERVREELSKLGDARFLQLDVSEVRSIEALIERDLPALGRIDVLVNNAGIFIDEDRSTLADEAALIESTFRTNTLGPFLLCRAIVPIMQRQGYGRIVNVSSGMGQLSEMDGGSPAYRISKTALNAVTKIYAAQTRGSNVLVNSICPGWVRTDMGGSGAPRSLQEGASGIVWAATLPEGGPSGGFFRDGEPIEW